MGKGVHVFVSIHSLVRLVNRPPMDLEEFQQQPGCPVCRELSFKGERLYVVQFPFVKLFLDVLRDAYADSVTIFGACSADLLQAICDVLQLTHCVNAVTTISDDGEMAPTFTNVAGRTLGSLAKMADPMFYYDCSLIVDVSAEKWHPAVASGQLILCPGLLPADGFSIRYNRSLFKHQSGSDLMPIVDSKCLSQGPFAKKGSISPLLLAANTVKKVVLMRHGSAGTVSVQGCLQHLRANLFTGCRFRVACDDPSTAALICTHGGIIVPDDPTHIVASDRNQLIATLGDGFEDILGKEGMGSFAPLPTKRRLVADEYSARCGSVSESSDVDVGSVENGSAPSSSSSSANTSSTSSDDASSTDIEEKKAAEKVEQDEGAKEKEEATDANKRKTTVTRKKKNLAKFNLAVATAEEGLAAASAPFTEKQPVLDAQTCIANRTIAVHSRWIRSCVYSLQLFPAHILLGMNHQMILQLMAPPPIHVANARKMGIVDTTRWMSLDAVYQCWKRWKLRELNDTAFNILFHREEDIFPAFVEGADATAVANAVNPRITDARCVGDVCHLVASKDKAKYAVVRMSTLEDALMEESAQRHVMTALIHCHSDRKEWFAIKKEAAIVEAKERAKIDSSRGVMQAMGTQTVDVSLGSTNRNGRRKISPVLEGLPDFNSDSENNSTDGRDATDASKNGESAKRKRENSKDAGGGRGSVQVDDADTLQNKVAKQEPSAVTTETKSYSRNDPPLLPPAVAPSPPPTVQLRPPARPPVDYHQHQAQTQQHSAIQPPHQPPIQHQGAVLPPPPPAQQHAVPFIPTQEDLNFMRSINLDTIHDGNFAAAVGFVENELRPSHPDLANNAMRLLRAMFPRMF